MINVAILEHHSCAETYCAIQGMNVKLYLIGLIRENFSQWPSSLHQGKKFIKNDNNGYYDNHSAGLNKSSQTKEYRFHFPIYHIFWELQFADPPCNTKNEVNCRDFAQIPVARVFPNMSEGHSVRGRAEWVHGRLGGGMKITPIITDEEDLVRHNTISLALSLPWREINTRERYEGKSRPSKSKSSDW
jgi:hypothetical protein